VSTNKLIFSSSGLRDQSSTTSQEWVRRQGQRLVPILGLLQEGQQLHPRHLRLKELQFRRKDKSTCKAITKQTTAKQLPVSESVHKTENRPKEGNLHSNITRRPG